MFLLGLSASHCREEGEQSNVRGGILCLSFAEAKLSVPARDFSKPCGAGSAAPLFASLTPNFQSMLGGQ